MRRAWMLVDFLGAGLCVARGVVEGDVFWFGLALWFVAGLVERAR